ncbi:hypothetical protein KAR91_17135 [Candidatus Pacearchaeota archaeon]|nr:hypothetical protein [Candidatus Pacearchaeota archaeon]
MPDNDQIVQTNYTKGTVTIHGLEYELAGFREIAEKGFDPDQWFRLSSKPGEPVKIYSRTGNIVSK